MTFDDAVGVRQLLESRHYFSHCSGENKVPIALMQDNHSEELSFPQIYLGDARFAMASSEIRWTDRDGVEPTHVLYTAMKVMRHSLVENSMTFHCNDATRAMARQQLESGEFLEDAASRALAFKCGIPNTIQYWQNRK
ncbi:hypothetical protein HPB48_000772 [Haemaphysalis longicornis]|uniref:Uncharacterized protein n=1 Tax=Haemaphysalis longicornis TaxID=44386 RepID=A0A9J6G9H3_HAELO|nr:hypothetical protein HPB48_000772 [Haemaphysalis longicornis]